MEFLNAHPITTFIVLAAMLVTPFYIFATFAFSGASLKRGGVLASLALVFGAAMFIVCIYAVPDQLGVVGNLIIPVVWILPSLVLFWFREWVLAERLSSHYLISLQLWRAIGAVFLIEMARGNLPGVFAYPAGVGDVLVAVAALIVLIQYRNAKDISAPAIHVVGVLGVLDFCAAFFFGFTSSDSPIQLFSQDNPNQVSLFPTGLIPLFLVPYAIFFHVLAWLNLAKHGTRLQQTAP
ncbi:MAG: hypothetical protein AAF065_04505 [Verrucomicrobiota bacterium]